MKRIALFTLSVLLALLLSRPVRAMEIPPEEGDTDTPIQIQGCINSTFGQYSYQGDIDPQTITREWIVLDEQTRPYGPGSIEIYYRNPDMPCEIPIAVFLVHKGAFLSFAYLQCGDVHLYALDLDSKCYRGDVLKGFARHSFKARLGEALGLRPS